MTISAASLRTNRDLYLFVGELAQRHEGHPRTLESYLRAIRAIVGAGAYGHALPVGTFASILVEAFDHPLPPDGCATSPGETAGRGAWETHITAQIADLEGMAAAGSLDDEMRYFGIDAPSGARWYNFVPSSYIEAGVVGAFGGWDADDDTGRTLVPGPVAAMDPATGKIISVDPSELDRPVVELLTIDWEQLTAFLECGALYE